jgi:ABC-type transport system involved in cytochrome bd biosynthesis fused ATPase/permease subunit
MGRASGLRLSSLRGDLAALLVDGVQGQAELLSFGCPSAGSATAAAALAARRDAVREQGRIARASALGSALAGLGADLTALGVLALAIPAVRAGSLDGTHLAVVTLLALAAFEAVAALPAAWQATGAVDGSARRLFEVADLEPAVAEPALPAPTVEAPRVLDVRDLRFT